jgi:hypothetical protein
MTSIMRTQCISDAVDSKFERDHHFSDPVDKNNIHAATIADAMTVKTCTRDQHLLLEDRH